MIDINTERKKLGLTQKELASKLGVSYQTIQNWEKGSVIPKSKIKMVEEIFKVDLSVEKPITKADKTEEQIQPTGFYYPGVSASAGLEIEMNNDELKRVPINIPNWEKGIDFINVYGDSMYPKFCSGEIIGIKQVDHQFVNYGYAYVVILNDGQVFLKYIKKGKDDEHWLLASENPRYEPKEYHLSLIKKVFIIKGVITKTTM